ncbi:MAG: FAD-dependent oxidoreductase [Cyclobacteriaceae bacterium]
MDNSHGQCVIIGASHAGVSCAFFLRREGWSGNIILIDPDPELPYHRPPLSKAFLTSEAGIEQYALKSREAYEKENIELRLGVVVANIDRSSKSLKLSDDTQLDYDILVIATGARPLIPPISGIDQAQNLYPLRTAKDVSDIKEAISKFRQPKVVIIGGGYIGLEIAASVKKLGADATILERESRVLARVTSPEMSTYFETLHAEHGVQIASAKNVTEITVANDSNLVKCGDGSTYPADVIIVGVGIRVNDELAVAAGLESINGIVVKTNTQTADDAIYAIGDCTSHYNPHYQRQLRLESVQNANDQAKIAAAAICGKEAVYDAIPWFWSDQFDAKLQMVGLSAGYDEVIVRIESNESKRSLWYFKGEELLAVDAVNNPKAYVIGGKFIKERITVNKVSLRDPEVDLKPANLI